MDALYRLLLAETAVGRWRPGIGDPTLFGWLTVAAYLACAATCVAAARSDRRRPFEGLPTNPIFWRAGITDGAQPKLGPAQSTGTAFWWLLAALLLALGINKQLDLQSAVTQLGRDMAHSQGWYQGRAAVQKAFIVGVAILGLGSLTVAGVLFRQAILRRPVAALGGSFLITFVVIRAASFHHVDRFLKLEVAGLRWNWIFELGGIALVAVSALAHLRGVRRL